MAQTIVNNPVVLGNNALSVESLPSIVYRDQPVITTRVLAELYGTDQVNIRKNLSANKSRFILGRHYFRVEGEELRELKACVTESNACLVPKSGGVLTLWTARGAARHAKMLDTDKAWDVFELLEENYFNRRPYPAPTPTSLSPAQQQELKELVQAKASAYPGAVRGKLIAQVWSRVQRKFKIPRYAELPASLFGEARDYIIGMQIRGIEPEALPEAESPKALPPAEILPAELGLKLRHLRAIKQEMMDISADIYHTAKRSIRPKQTEFGRPAFSLLVNMNYAVEDVLYGLDRNLDTLEHLCTAGELAARVFSGSVAAR